MSSNVVITLQAKPDQVNPLIEFLTSLHDRVIEAGALTASLMQDEDDPARVVELEVWPSADQHRKFLEAAATEHALKPLDDLLLVPLQKNYLDTVKYSRNRRL